MSAEKSLSGQDVQEEQESQGVEEQRFQTDKVLLLSFCHFVHDVYTSFLAPLQPFLIERFSLSLAQAGLLSTILQLPALLNPLIGKLADRISVRYFVILAPAMTAIPMSMLGLANGYGMLLLLLFLTGISVSMFHVPTPVMIYRVAGNKTGRGMSFYMTGGELARAIGPMIIIAVVSLLGFDHYYPVALFGIFVSVIMYWKFADIPIRLAEKKSSSLRKTWKELRFLLVPLTGILVARGFMHASLAAFLPVYIMQETGNLWLSGISLAVFEGAGVLGIMGAGPLSDRLGRKKVLMTSLTLAPIFLFVFTRVSGSMQLLVLVFTGLTVLSTTPVMLALIQESTPGGSSMANGLFMMISFLARSGVIVLVGFIADHIGLSATYVVSACCGVLGIPFLLMLRPHSPGKEKH